MTADLAAEARKLVERWREWLDFPKSLAITVQFGDVQEFSAAAGHGDDGLAFTIGNPENTEFSICIDFRALDRDDLEQIIVHELVHVWSFSQVGDDLRANMEVLTDELARIIRERRLHPHYPKDSQGWLADEPEPKPEHLEAFTEVFLAGAAFWEHQETGFHLNEHERGIVIDEARRRIAEVAERRAAAGCRAPDTGLSSACHCTSNLPLPPPKNGKCPWCALPRTTERMEYQYYGGHARGAEDEAL